MDNMDIPVCLSHDFVNKQNVRSFQNVLKSEENSPLFGADADKNLLNEITPDLLSVLTEMKEKLNTKSKKDFKEYFVIDNSTMHSVNKQVVLKRSWKAICDIIPKPFYGDLNGKILRRLVVSAIFSMRRQHFVIKRFTDKWIFATPLWKTPNTDISKKILNNILIWILKNILSPIISLNFYVTTCKIDCDENKLHFFWKHQWQSFYDRKISEMIFTKVLIKCEPYCLGKKIRKNRSLGERINLKSLKKEVPRMHLILKANNNYRPIVQYKNNSHNRAEKYKIKERLNFLKVLIGKPQEKIETQFSGLHVKWLKFNKPQLYFIKTDLSNAFGAVNKDKLLKIVCEKHLAIQKVEKNVNLKKKYAQQYKDIITELRKPLLVRAGSTVFEWREGLVQGYKYSPALSELYYKYLDEMYFAEHFKKSIAKIQLFTRVVDDYLYVTDSLVDAHSFLNALSNYRNVNYSKTEVNFDHPSIKFRKEITFLGYSYNTENLQVSRAATAFNGQMCYKMAFTSAVTDVNKFLENRISQSGIPISNLLFNFSHNPEELIWRHVFTTFCLSANKFCTTLAILCEVKGMLAYLVLYKKKVVVRLGNSMIETLLKNKPSDHLFIFCINHFRHLAWKALYLCAKGTPKCSGLIPLINDEVAKTNCLFGKWRDHASSIATNGETIQVATKEICRRSDLRMIVKQFDRLPTDFECYHHRKILN